jgi:hypothetical protein
MEVFAIPKCSTLWRTLMLAPTVNLSSDDAAIDTAYHLPQETAAWDALGFADRL